jgi:putative flippase GtrA
VSELQRQERRALIGQIIRFGISGGLLTIFVAAGYWAIAEFLHIDPNISLLIIFVIASGVGYILHSRFSFRGHGERDNPHIRTIKFLTTNCLGFAANQFFVWLLVKQLGGPTWWAIPPIIMATPLLTFTLNRKWVFG